MPRRLSLSFADVVKFQEEYGRNISKGGAFVRTAEKFEVRDLVEVELEFGFCDASVVLEAEIVHAVPAEQAGSEAAAGVAVQFLEPAPVLRDTLQRFIGGSAFDEADLAQTAASPLFSEDDVATVDSVELSALGQVGEVGETPLFDPSEVDLSSGGEEEYAFAESLDRRETPPVQTPDPSELDAEFVEDVNQARQDRERAGIHGAIEELGMAALLRMFAGNAKRGTLRVVSGSEAGSIGFEGGVLRHLQLGEVRGLKALSRLLSWKRGSFEFHARLDPSDGEPLSIPVEEAMAEATRQHDDLIRAEGTGMLDPAARFEIDREALHRKSGLNNAEEAVLDLVGARFNVRRILDVIPQSDVEVIAALKNLLDREIIRPV